MWRFLRQPAVAIVLAALLLGLLLIARIIPQSQGRPSKTLHAARWLNAERDAWGAWGGLLPQHSVSLLWQPVLSSLP